MDVLNYFKNGGIVVVLDDQDRENEGDLIMSAAHCTKEKIAFMIRHSTGILCAAMNETIAESLGLSRMVTENTDPHSTAFTVTCDSIGAGTGVSAKDRCLTLKMLADSKTTADQLRKPGHVFPLIAKNGLLKQRRGHTEATVQLCRTAGIHEVGVLCELMNDNGTMMTRKKCRLFATMHGLPCLTIDELNNINTIVHLPIVPVTREAA